MFARFSLVSIAVGLLLLVGGVFLSEGYSSKRGFLESLPKMKVRLTADEQHARFSQILLTDTANGLVVRFEDKLIQMPYAMANSELSRIVKAFSDQKLGPPQPNHKYFFEGWWTVEPGMSIPLSVLLTAASALIIIGATVLVGARIRTNTIIEAPIAITGDTESSNSVQARPPEVQTPVKRSRLRLALHLWGGVCIKAAADISGLVVVRGGSDVESALSAAVAAGLIAVLLFLVGYYLSHQLVAVLDRASIAPKVKKTTMILLPIAYSVGAIVVGGVAGFLAGQR